MIDLLFVMLFSASACLIGLVALVISTLLFVITLFVLSIKTFYKGMVFIANRSWDWLRAPLNY